MNNIIIVSEDLDEFPLLEEEQAKPVKKESRSDQKANPQDESIKSEDLDDIRALKRIKTGLISATEIQQENLTKKRLLDKKINEMTEEESGKNAQTVLRDRRGRIKNVEDEKLNAELEEKRKLEKEQRNRAMQEGKVQKEERENRKKALERSKNLKFSRYSNDDEMNQMRKQELHWNDPMRSHSVKDKISEKPLYRGQPSLNRFNIVPGYRWDGVDRSNGYERKWFNAKYEHQSMKQQAFQWSTEDM